jgi:ornithine lipid ester-linked acyl 2-hydroxylase
MARDTLMAKLVAEPQREPLQQAGQAQVFGTDGIKPLGRPSASVRLMMGIVAWVERLNLKYSKTGNPSVYETASFPWAAEIEREWKTIRRELDGVMQRKEELPNFQDISTDVVSISKDRGWKTFLLGGYGLKSEQNIALCPETWRIVQKVPGLKTAMFSIFEPGKHLPAHRGPYNGLLRLHLGLIVPEPRELVAIRVGSQVCHWEEGRVLIFDDAYEHEAWNRTGKTRVVLFVDFVKPLRFPANVLNWLILNLAVFTPFVQEGYENHRKWEEKFHTKQQG